MYSWDIWTFFAFDINFVKRNVTLSNNQNTLKSQEIALVTKHYFD